MIYVDKWWQRYLNSSSTLLNSCVFFPFFSILRCLQWWNHNWYLERQSLTTKGEKRGVWESERNMDACLVSIQNEMAGSILVELDSWSSSSSVAWTAHCDLDTRRCSSQFADWGYCVSDEVKELCGHYKLPTDKNIISPLLLMSSSYCVSIIVDVILPSLCHCNICFKRKCLLLLGCTGQ